MRRKESCGLTKVRAGPRSAIVVPDFSFHETKIVIAGEGRSSALFWRSEACAARRNHSHRREPMRGAGSSAGEVDKYHLARYWLRHFCPESHHRCFPLGQLGGSRITWRYGKRSGNATHECCPARAAGLLFAPRSLPADCLHTAHVLYSTLAWTDRHLFLERTQKHGIHACFTMSPRLHSSPAGLGVRRADARALTLSLTTSLSQSLVRLPMWLCLSEIQQQRVCDVLNAILIK